MFGHWYDILAVAVVALLVFGPKRLPEMGSAIGKTFKEFKKSMSEVTEPVKGDVTEMQRQITAATTPTEE